MPPPVRRSLPLPCTSRKNRSASSRAQAISRPRPASRPSRRMAWRSQYRPGPASSRSGGGAYSGTGQHGSGDGRPVDHRLEVGGDEDARLAGPAGRDLDDVEVAAHPRREHLGRRVAGEVGQEEGRGRGRDPRRSPPAVRRRTAGREARLQPRQALAGGLRERGERPAVLERRPCRGRRRRGAAGAAQDRDGGGHGGAPRSRPAHPRDSWNTSPGSSTAVRKPPRPQPVSMPTTSPST